MTFDNPDWFGSVIPMMSMLPKDAEIWYDVDQGSIAGLSNEAWISYTVPTSKILQLTYGMVSCDFPCIQQCAMNFSPALLGNVYYDLLFNLPLHPNAAYEIAAGSELYVQMYNLDADAHNFTCSLLGWLELTT